MKDFMSAKSNLAMSQAARQLEEEERQRELAYHPLTLVFKSSMVEGEFLAEVSCSRYPVLIIIFIFDLSVYLIRFGVRALGSNRSIGGIAQDFTTQIVNMLVLYFLMVLLNLRTRRCQSLRVAKQEEFLLAMLMAVAISSLLLSLKPGSRDYVYASFFLICATSVLKIRWLVGTLMLAGPVILAGASLLHQYASASAPSYFGGTFEGYMRRFTAGWVASGSLPFEAVLHLLVAWAVGGLMSFLLDTNRRQAFTNHTLALAAAEKELAEMRARAGVERELAAAQAQAAARNLVVAREKASNEAKSEFMSLMCHEVRTPLNGCLASAEMLLETDLTAEQHDLARTIRVSGSILLSTVSNFLDFFKMEAGKQLDIVRTPLVLHDLVGDVHCIIEAMIGRGGAVSLLKPDFCGVPDTVMGDPNRVCGILLNLYTNAAKFTKQGAVGLRVRVVEEGYRPDVESAVKFYHDALGGASPRISSSSAATDALASESLSSSLDSSLGDGQLEDKCGLPSTIRVRRPSWQSNPTAGYFLPARGQARQSNDALQDKAAAPGEGLHTPLHRHPRPSLQYEMRWTSDSKNEESNESKERGGSMPGHQPGLPMPSHAQAGVPATAAFMRSSADFDSAQSLPAAVSLAQQVQEEVAAGKQALKAAMELRHLGDGWTSVCSLGGGAAGQASSGRKSTAERAAGRASEKKWLVFEVQDTGAGVAAHSMSSLFQDYVQGTNLEMRRARSRGGTGLGLSICSKQAAVLGGQIGALSKPNRGSVFWFTIPLRTPSKSSGPAKKSVTPSPLVPMEMPAMGTKTAEVVPDASSPKPHRNSLERELTSLWGMDRPYNTAEDGSLHRSSLSAQASPRPSTEGSRGAGGEGSRLRHGNNFGWYHLPPAGRAARTAANRLKTQPEEQQGLVEDTPGPSAGRADAVVPVGSAGAGCMAAAAAAALVPTPAAAGAYTHAGRGYGLWVLLAEDNLINQTVAKKMLSTLGMKCQVASNGREAVDAVQQAFESGMNFDLVLMDMCMPVVNGVDATKAIRQMGCTTPIVAMTANASERDRQECLAAGMNGFLSKPVLKDKLLDAIMTAFEAGNA